MSNGNKLIEELKHQCRFTRLSYLVENSRKEIAKNPFPIINELVDKQFQMEQLLVDIENVINPPPILMPEGGPIERLDIGGEALQRLDKIQNLIDDWKDTFNAQEKEHGK